MGVIPGAFFFFPSIPQKTIHPTNGLQNGLQLHYFMRYQYYNSHVLLVINSKGVIRQLHTPFRVMEQFTNSLVYVDEILTNEKDELLFVVNDHPLLHSNFRVIIHF